MKIYSVSEFNEIIDQTLREMNVFVQGEVSNFKISQDKWVSFDLKDGQARMSCFIIKFQLNVEIEDGMEVKVFGSPGLYVPYGKFTFRVKQIEPVGEGALQKAFELTKKKLEKEGVFNPEYKKVLPRFPDKIGLITSEGAAAYTDVLRILNNRWAGLSIFLLPVLVQGEESPNQIIHAIQYYNQYHPVDVIILTRGGGSLEDLQSFNSELVCRAIFASKIPVVCGVGHEWDTTLADLAADQRASTPSNAAERVVHNKQDALNEISWKIQSISDSISMLIEQNYGRVDKHIIQIGEGVRSWKEKFTYLHEKIFQQLRNFSQRVGWDKEKLASGINQLQERYSFGIEKLKQKINNQEKVISSLSPQATLERGYSLTYFKDKRKIIRDKKQVKPGDQLKTRLAKGEIISKAN